MSAGICKNTPDTHQGYDTPATYSDNTSADSNAPNPPVGQDKVLNLTNRSFSDSLFKLLSKGPNFALSRQIGKKVLYAVEKGIERGAFALRWRLYIASKHKQQPQGQDQQPTEQHKHSDNTDVTTNTQPTEHSQSKSKTLNMTPRFSDTETRMAPISDPDTEQFLRSLKRKIMNLFKNHTNNNQANHSKEDIQGLNALRSDQDLIVKRSDKCKGFVLMPKEMYIKKAETITSQYEEVPKKPTPRLEAATKKIISHELGGKIPDKIVSAIKPTTSSRTAELYGLPKSHKSEIPLRPIVSACGDPLDKLTWFLERIISQLLPFVPSHLRNTYDYLDRLKQTFPRGAPANAILFTVDVANLYGNIPIKEAIDATMKLIAKHQNNIDLLGLDMKTIENLISHCLTNNYVRFGSKFYKQSEGIAMGSRVAPPLAIIFMDAIESMMPSSSDLQPAIYMRYIDDIFGIWTHGADSLDQFIDHMNSFHPSLKFTAERSDHSDNKQIPFLDTLVKLEENGSLTTELYIKPMTSPIILPFNSAHPMQTKRSVLYAQLLRAKRLGSSPSAQNRGMNKIEQLFISNDYPKKLINKTKFRVKTQSQSRSTQTKKPSQTQPTESTYISLPFVDDCLARKVESVVKTSKLPVRIAWQSGVTLADKLTNSALEQPTCPSGNKKCHCCLAGLNGKCHSKNAVYKITCNLCPSKDSYIGESKRSVRLRYNEHLRDAKNKTKNTPFGEHFSKCHQNVKLDEKTLTISILHICKDIAELKIAESIEIRNHKPVLNIMSSSWALIKPVPYSEL